MTVGQGNFRYKLDDEWGRMPNGDRTRYVSMIACDAEDRIYAFCRAGEAVRVFSPQGDLIASWGEGLFLRPHGIGVSPGGQVYCVDDKAHVIRSFTFDGRPIRVWGEFGTPRIAEEEGALEPDKAAKFFAPTDIAFAPDGTMFITDGYGNSEVHRFSSHGEWEFTWGTPGQGPSQFKTVHAVCLDSKGRVIVADRGNDRLQVFTPNGELLAIMDDVLHPNAIQCDAQDYIYSTGKGQVDIRTPDGELVCRWGKRHIDQDVREQEILHRAHGLAIDSSGNLYLGDEMHDHGGFLRRYVRV